MRFAPVLLSSVLLMVACDKPSATTDADAMSAGASGSASASASTSASAGASDGDAGAPSKPTGKTVDTPAGTAAEVGNHIELAGKTIYPPDCAAGGKDACAKVKALYHAEDSVKILRHFDGPGGQKSILLIQVMPAGNACASGPLFFVRLSSSKAPEYSDVFDYCGGPDPMVGAMPDKILINVPAHPPNHGTGTLPAKQMEYDIAAGTLQTSAPSTKKKK